jgi:hypothetical protein
MTGAERRKNILSIATRAHSKFFSFVLLLQFFFRTQCVQPASTLKKILGNHSQNAISIITMGEKRILDEWNEFLIKIYDFCYFSILADFINFREK